MRKVVLLQFIVALDALALDATLQHYISCISCSSDGSIEGVLRVVVVVMAAAAALVVWCVV